MKANKKHMEEEWQAGKPIEHLFSQINDAMEYGIFSRFPINDANLVQTAESLILQNGNYAQEYKDWRSTPLTLCKWAEFQDWWQKSYRLCEETETTAVALDYTANVVTEKSNDNTTIDNAVANFGKAFATNSTIISQLTEANNTLHHNFVEKMENL